VTAYTGPHLLQPHHDIDGFDCGDGSLNRWLRERARHNQNQVASRTWVVTDGVAVAGYYASSAAVVLRADATKRAARNQPDPLPALLLGRLAVHIDHQSRGLGAALLKHFVLKSIEVAQLIGVRVLLVRAKDARAASFYQHHGFQPSPVDDLTLMAIMTDIGAPDP